MINSESYNTIHSDEKILSDHTKRCLMSDNNNNSGKNDDDNANNGLITKIWGPALWTSLHCISFGYPLEPTDEQKNEYKTFFQLIGAVMPCKYCRESYQKFISEGETRLTDEVMKNRKSLTYWLYLVHQVVNNKLGVDYGVSYDDVVKRYEAYRAKCTKAIQPVVKGCVVPLNDKKMSFKYANYKNCSIISVSIAKNFLYYAKLRKLCAKNFIFINEYIKNEKIRNKNADLDCKEWYRRNIECSEIINKMRIDGIPSIEVDGEYKGLPTKQELKLIVRLSSNLTKEELLEILNKLPYPNRNHYHNSNSNSDSNSNPNPNPNVRYIIKKEIM